MWLHMPNQFSFSRIVHDECLSTDLNAAQKSTKQSIMPRNSVRTPLIVERFEGRRGSMTLNARPHSLLLSVAAACWRPLIQYAINLFTPNPQNRSRSSIWKLGMDNLVNCSGFRTKQIQWSVVHHQKFDGVNQYCENV